MREWTEYYAAVPLHLCVAMLVDNVSNKDVRNQESAQHPTEDNQCFDPLNSRSCGVPDVCTEPASVQQSQKR